MLSTTAWLWPASREYPRLLRGDFAAELEATPRGTPGTGALGSSVLRHAAGRRAGSGPAAWKLPAPAAILARIELGQDAATTEAEILQLPRWAGYGSEWDAREIYGFHKSYDDPLRIGRRGDFDFTATVLITILYRHGGSARLGAAAEAHLLGLLSERGGGFRSAVPGSCGLVAESENHVLMTESARYLTNQWLRQRGDADPGFDNAANGLEPRLVRELGGMLGGGMWEFNSNPYLGYAVHPLLNLEAFAGSHELRQLARAILDDISWEQAFGSLLHRRVLPFRRTPACAANASLCADPATAIMGAWAEPVVISGAIRQRIVSDPHAAIASLMPYRPPTAALALANDEARGSFAVRFGRGPESPPTTLSGGDGWLLSGGGAGLGSGHWATLRHQLAVRPITLLLDDHALDLSACLRIASPGDPGNWNGTGVSDRFACGAGSLIVPDGWLPLAEHAPWRIWAAPRRTLLATASLPGMALIAVFPDRTPEQADALLGRIERTNPSAAELVRRFAWPDGGSVSYEVGAPFGTWVISAMDDRPTDRQWGSWPRMQGWWIR